MPASYSLLTALYFTRCPSAQCLCLSCWPLLACQSVCVPHRAGPRSASPLTFSTKTSHAGMGVGTLLDHMVSRVPNWASRGNQKHKSLWALHLRVRAQNSMHDRRVQLPSLSRLASATFVSVCCVETPLLPPLYYPPQYWYIVNFSAHAYSVQTSSCYVALHCLGCQGNICWHWAALFTLCIRVAEGVYGNLSHSFGPPRLPLLHPSSGITLLCPAIW